ncbi:MAG: VOC family protein [Actinomycetota bacterium]|nr:VOC family protein [Actinomycetota bacterium]
MINGFQHVGIGVFNMDESCAFYRKVLNFRVTLNDHEEEVEQMVPIIKELVRMRLMMVMNMNGGGVVELAQHTSSKPRPMPEERRWGDIGYLSAGLHANGIEDLSLRLKEQGVKVLTPIIECEYGHGGKWKSFYVEDPNGIILELLETAELRASGGKPRIGGFSHVTIGVSDIEKSLSFYKVLGYDTIITDSQESTSELETITKGARTRTVFLSRSKEPSGNLPVPGGMVRLVQALDFKGNPIYEGRRWGDVGIMEMALDIESVRETYDLLTEKGALPLSEPTSIDMGTGSVGTFAYVKDPDGNIIELVEVEKLAYLPPSLIGPVLKAALRLSSKLRGIR